MDTAAIVLYGLVSTSVLLCIALAVAWRRFGRELHAALWSLAYGLSAANWAFNLVRIWLRPDDALLTMLGAICTVGSFALIALGFRRRAGMPLRIDVIGAAAGVTVLFVGIGLIRPAELGAQRWLVAFFCAAMLIVSAHSLRRAERANRATGGVAFWMLVLFAAYTIGLGGIAVLIPAASPAGGEMLRLFRMVLLIGVPTGLFGVGLFAMFLLAADLAEAMRELASSDPLTGILNRRGFEQAAEKAIATCRRGARPIVVAVADIDRFKTVNDRFGHAIGDEVLRRFARHAAATLRTGDLLGRLGGEEFAFVFPDTTLAQAAEAVERIRHSLADAINGLALPTVITASYGIAALGGRTDTLGGALGQADQALYRSKMDGRDRVTLAPPELVELETTRPARVRPRSTRARG